MAKVVLPAHHVDIIHSSKRRALPSGERPSGHVMGFVDKKGNDTGVFLAGTQVHDVTHLNFLPLLGSRHGRNRDVVSVKTPEGRLVYKLPKNTPALPHTMLTLDEERYDELEESIPCARHVRTHALPDVAYTNPAGNVHNLGMRVIVEEDVGRKNLSEERFNIHVSKKGLGRMKGALAQMVHNSIIMLQKGYLIDIKPENFVIRERGKRHELVLVDKDSLAEVDEDTWRGSLRLLGENLGKSFADLFMLNDPLLDHSRYHDIRDFLDGKIMSWTLAPRKDLQGEELPELTVKDANKIIGSMHGYLDKKFSREPIEIDTRGRLKLPVQEPKKKKALRNFNFDEGASSQAIMELSAKYEDRLGNLLQMDHNIRNLEGELKKGSDMGLISVGRGKQINRSFHFHRLAMLEAKIGTYKKIIADLKKAVPESPAAKKEIDEHIAYAKKLKKLFRKKYKKTKQELEEEEVAVGTLESVDLYDYTMPVTHNTILKALDTYKTTMASNITMEGAELSTALKQAEKDGQLPEGTATRLGTLLAMQNLSLLENDFEMYRHALDGLEQQKKDFQQRRYDEFRHMVETQRLDGLMESIRKNRQMQSVNDYLATDYVGKQINVLAQNKDRHGFKVLLKSMSEGELDELSKAVSSLPKQTEDELDYNIERCEKNLTELEKLIAPVKKLTDQYYQ
ncbi:MAG: hypothetical protein KAW41_02820 [Candidatus Diapherotrites archaeon]|nr:hypothetical protein [Candidatus Diapherotrites archaeon]